MEYLLVEVQAVHADLVLLPLAPGGHLAGLQRGSWFAALPGRLQRDVPSGVAVEHSEEVVVRPGHDGTEREERERERTRESLFTLDKKDWCQTQRGIQTSKSTVRMGKGSRETTKEGVL